MNNVNCQVCGGTSPYYCSKGSFKYFRCSQCFIVFVDPMPDSSAIYEKDYFEGATHGYGYVNYDEDKKSMYPVFEKYLKEIQNFTGKKGKLLDIGAAKGSFIKYAKDRGWEVAGVELSEYASANGRSSGLDIRTGIVEDAGFSNNSFDAITMFDVIEHLSHPASTLKKAMDLLVSGGVIVINTPDSGSVWARTFGTKWHSLIPPEHLMLFNEKSLRIILKNNGFDFLRATRIGKNFPIPYIFKIAHAWLKIGLIGRMATLFDRDPFRNISIPLDIRDNIFVVAKKK